MNNYLTTYPIMGQVMGQTAAPSLTPVNGGTMTMTSPMTMGQPATSVWNMQQPMQQQPQRVPLGPSAFSFNSISQQDWQALSQAVQQIYNGPDAVDMSFKSTGKKTTVTITKSQDEQRQCAVERGETDSRGRRQTITRGNALTFNRISETLRAQRQPVTVNYRQVDENTLEITFCTRKSHMDALARGMKRTPCTAEAEESACQDDPSAVDTPLDTIPDDEQLGSPKARSSRPYDEDAVDQSMTTHAPAERFTPIDENGMPITDKKKIVH